MAAAPIVASSLASQIDTAARDLLSEELNEPSPDLGFCAPLPAFYAGVGGELAGKDLVNMIKATMEWVDIPILLWTREAVSSQKEARQIHGADEVVSKGQGEAALVARVITLFRR